jgi:FMN-dependent NADH-azoreductase
MLLHAVSYLPRGERSATRRLLTAALASVGGRAEVDHLELATAIPDLFTPERLMDYIRRDYLGETLDAPARSRLAGMDALIRRLTAADAVILATPMHNFSFPAIVKAWFDAVMLKGHTWDIGPDGYHGLMTGRRALLLASSGGIYADTPAASWDHLVSLTKIEFGFLGYDPVEHVVAGGMNQLEEPAKTAALAQAETDAAAAARRLLVR